MHEPQEQNRKPNPTPDPLPGPPPSASTAPASFQPILGERIQRRFDLLSSQPKIRARVALVIVTANGKPRVFGPEQRPTVGELFWNGSGTVYEVDMGLHQTTVELDLPSNGDAFAFHTVAEIEWRVRDAIQIVKDGVVDIRETLRPRLQQRLATVTRKYSSKAVANAEDEAMTVLAEDDIGKPYGLETTISLRMRMDKPSTGQIVAIAEVQHRIELERLTQELRQLQEEHHRQLVEVRVTTYREYIAAGDIERAALQLAQNPDDVAAVMQIVREEQNEDRRQKTELVSQLLESGAIDRWEIDDDVRTVLAWLKDSTRRIIRPVDTVRIPAQQGGDLPAADLPQSSLPQHPDPPGGAASPDR